MKLKLKQNRIKFGLVILSLLIGFSACQSAQVMDSEESPSVPIESATPIESTKEETKSTEEPRKTIEPTETLEPMPTRPPAGTELISVNNASEIIELNRMGKGTITGLKYSPDGKTIAVTTSIGIHFYDSETLTELKQIETNVHTYKPYWLPDGKEIVTYSFDGSVRLWDVTNGDLLSNFKPYDNFVYGFAVSADGSMVATGDWNGKADIWELTSGKKICTITEDTDSFHSVNFALDSSTIATGSNDGTIRLWNLSTCELISTIKEQEERINDIAFSPDGKMLASGQLFSVIIYDVDSGEQLEDFSGHSSSILDIQFSSDGSRLFTQDLSYVHLWDLNTGEEVLKYEGHKGTTAYGFDISRDEEEIISYDSSGTIRRWEITTGADLAVISDFSLFILEASISPDGSHIVLSDGWGSIHLWDINQGQLIATKKNIKLPTIEFTPDGRIFGADPGGLYIFDGQTLDLQQTIDEQNRIRSLSFSPDGKKMASGEGRDKIVKISNVDTGEEITALEIETEAVMNVIFSPDDSVLAIGTYDGKIFIYDTEEYLEINVLEGHEDQITNMVFTNDGKKLVSTSIDQTIRVWDLETGKEILRFGENEGYSRSVAISLDDTLLISGHDGYICIWDFSSGKLLYKIEGHTDFIRSVYFIDNGKKILSGSGDGTIRIWGIP